jgi:hypothetical protein
MQVLTRNANEQLVVLGYTMHDLQDEEGKLKFGTWERPMNDAPITFRDHDYGSSNGSSVCFSVMATDEETLQRSAAFIPNLKKQFTHTEFWKENEEDGCDIYIDAVRNMPDNVSIVKLLARVVDHDGMDLMDP